MKADDDNLLQRGTFVENPSLNALIRACLGIRTGTYRVRPPAGTGTRSGDEPLPDFQDTVPASRPRLRVAED